MKTQTIYIILVNYKSVEHTLECIQSIYDSTYKDIQIIVVDNHSEDHCRSIINNKYQHVVVIENEYNIGFAAANNIGIRKALKNNPGYILLLNNDTVLEKNCLSFLLDAGKEHPGCLITGKILNYYNRKLLWYGGGALNPYKGDANTFGFRQLDNGQCDVEMFCSFASGCCMLIPSEIAAEYPLSENYFLYYEDVDYCNQINQHNIGIFYTFKAVIFHKESASTKKSSALYSYFFSRNRLLYISKNIRGLKKACAYSYSLLWIAKKIVLKEFVGKYALCGVIDFRRGYMKNENISFK